MNFTQDQTASSINYSVTADCFETISEAGSPVPSFVVKAEYLTSSGICSSSPEQVVPTDICQSLSYSSTSRGRLPSNYFSLPPSETSYCNTPGGQSTADEYCQSKVDSSAVLQTKPTEEEYRLIDDAVNLLFDSGNIDSYLSLDISKNESNILETSMNFTQDQTASSIYYAVTADCFETISEAGSPVSSFVVKAEYLTSSGVCSSSPEQVVPTDICQSPSYSSTSRGRLPSNDFSLPISETSYCNTPGGQSTADEYCLSPPDFSSLLGSPETSDVFSPAPIDLTLNFISEEAAAESSVSVKVYDVNPETNMSDCDDLSMEKVTRSVRKRKFVKNGKEAPKDRVSLDDVFHPYKKPGGGWNKNDRKKVQNNEAAARYRMKKKREQREIMDEVSTLESQQKDLQKKHDSLVSKIKCLKSLMCEMLQKKGVLK